VRLGLFGGTFDPPHVGHLLAASDAFEALELDRLAFIPNAVQPLKAGQIGGAVAPAPDRLEMVRRLCQGDARFVCDSIEVDRGGLSFTIETLRAYRARFPGAALFLLIGEDVVGSLPSWRDSDDLVKLATLIVLTRGEGDPDAGWQWRRVNARRVDVSSTEIRERLKAGLSLTGFVPEQVAAYITERGLYR
jgi:nicotinate-nucleotide adenylyltransferase